MTSQTPTTAINSIRIVKNSIMSTSRNVTPSNSVAFKRASFYLENTMTDLSIQQFATVCFALAVLHTFSVKWFQHLAHRFPDGSPGENFFHLLGEVEVVFGIWAGVFLFGAGLMLGSTPVVGYLEGLNFTEPAFVFVIMVVSSTRAILYTAGRCLDTISRLIPLPRGAAFYFTTLLVGPLLGSLITEPAAMTVTALILLSRLYGEKISPALMYTTLAVLFVNVSVGGTLTTFAAPPVLMVARTWNWDLEFMLTHFAYKSTLACLVNSAVATALFYKELKKIKGPSRAESKANVPFWVIALHLVALTSIVVFHTKMVVFMGLFLFFLGLATVTKEYQDELKLRESLLVAFFLGGLVILGQPQRWWLEPVLLQLNAGTLFLGAMGLTAITDNAALTYLGAQVPTLSDISKYSLVAGAVAGGGLTVIANAPNPAGFSILNSSFGKDGIDPLKLFLFALAPTAVAGAALWFL